MSNRTASDIRVIKAAQLIHEAGIVLRSTKLTIADFQDYLTPALQSLQARIVNQTQQPAIIVDTAGVATLPKDQ